MQKITYECIILICKVILIKKGAYKLNKNAFTLAEVLITLGIIGVIAALTLPALINQKQIKELQVGLQKGYSMLSQVVQMINYGEGQTFNHKNYPWKSTAPVIDKYLVSTKACQGSCLIYKGNDKDENGDNIYGSYSFGDYRTYNKKANVRGNYFDDAQFLLRNGMTIYVEDSEFLGLSIDVNGMYKGPNLWGHDLFTFKVTNNGKLIPFGADGTGYSPDDFCSATDTSKYNGIACAYKALTEKDYFKNLPK